MVECNILDLELTPNSASDRSIGFRCDTDAPCDTHLMVSADRSYLNHADDDCIWTLFNGRLVVEPCDRGDLNGIAGSIDVDAGDRLALQQFNQLLGPYSKGIKSDVSSTITVRVVLCGPPTPEGIRAEQLQSDRGSRHR